MERTTNAIPADLTGTVDDRRTQLHGLGGDELDAVWLRRQLDSALLAWADCETELEIQKERHADY
ncbi:hypothetical protein OED01_15880 [Microbacterium sp. M28]|uniref:hypothetical protein n=1 Tax=Microbacterium sp. M28 TaxID=2962064 RepID=UPI0021F3D55D|nr:hypothetical protein [Microbacterium sp. M28]UYO97057.1 hypothetical protein OED01_15880 [Microbacterium sp. M28]